MTRLSAFACCCRRYACEQILTAGYHNTAVDLTDCLCFSTLEAPFVTNSPVYTADLELGISHASLRADTIMFAARQGDGGGWLLHVRQ